MLILNSHNYSINSPYLKFSYVIHIKYKIKNNSYVTLVSIFYMVKIQIHFKNVFEKYHKVEIQ